MHRKGQCAIVLPLCTLSCLPAATNVACPPQNLQVTGAVLVAPSSTTHSFNQNQRIIKLVMSKDIGSQTLRLTVSH